MLIDPMYRLSDLEHPVLFRLKNGTQKFILVRFDEKGQSIVYSEEPGGWSEAHYGAFARNDRADYEIELLNPADQDLPNDYRRRLMQTYANNVANFADEESAPPSNVAGWGKGADTTL